MIWYNFGPIRTLGSIVSRQTLRSLTETLKGPGSFTDSKFRNQKVNEVTFQFSILVFFGEEFKLCWCVQVWVSGKNICWMRTKPSLVWLLGELCLVAKIITKIWIWCVYDRKSTDNDNDVWNDNDHGDFGNVDDNDDKKHTNISPPLPPPPPMILAMPEDKRNFDIKNNYFVFPQINVLPLLSPRGKPNLTSVYPPFSSVITLPKVRPIDVKLDWIGAIKQSLEVSLDHSP